MNIDRFVIPAKRDAIALMFACTETNVRVKNIKVIDRVFVCNSKNRSQNFIVRVIKIFG